VKFFSFASGEGNSDASNFHFNQFPCQPFVNYVGVFALRAPIDNRQLFASEGATLSGINQ